MKVANFRITSKSDTPLMELVSITYPQNAITEFKINEFKITVQDDSQYNRLESFVFKIDDKEIKAKASHTKKKFGYRTVFAQVKKEKINTEFKTFAIECERIDGIRFMPIIETGQTVIVDLVAFLNLLQFISVFSFHYFPIFMWFFI
jgi:hypothetical protein